MITATATARYNPDWVFPYWLELELVSGDTGHRWNESHQFTQKASLENYAAYQGARYIQWIGEQKRLVE